MQKSEPYRVLGVGPTASQDEIKTAYRNLAKKFHPDLNPGNKESEKQFKEISLAYELVGTSEAREKFDRGEMDERLAQNEQSSHQRRGPFYHQTQEGGGRYSHQFNGLDEDLLNSIFSQMRNSGGSPFESSGQDQLYQMEVELKDAVLGAEKEIQLPNGKKLKVKIPAGVETGTKLRFVGQGGAGKGKVSAGDAYVQLNVKPSPIFERVGNDLEIELPISLSEAVLGVEVRVPTIDGAALIKIPAGVSSGQKLRIPGKGFPLRGGAKRGDELVILKVILPKEIDPEFRKAVESWTKRQPFNPRQRSSQEA